MASKWLCASWNIWQSGIFLFFIIFMVYFNILKSKVMVHWIEPTARFGYGVNKTQICSNNLFLSLLQLWSMLNPLLYPWYFEIHCHSFCQLLLIISYNSFWINGVYFLGVEVRNMKMDFNTGGTWRRVRQWYITGCYPSE